MNTFTVIGKSPASSGDRKSTYYSTTLSGYTPTWRKMSAPKTATELASEFERAQVADLVEKIKNRNTFTPSDAISDTLNNAHAMQAYNAPDNY